MNNKKVIGIYHKNCPDGTAAAAVLLRKFPAIEFFAISHSDVEDMLQKIREIADSENEIYFVDIASGVEDLLKKGHQVTVIDHHIGIKNELDELASKHKSLTYIFDNDKSGASLAWRYFFSDEEMPEIIKYVEDMDIWTLKYGDDTKYVTNYLSTNADTPEQMLEYIEGGNIEEIKEKGKIISDYNDVQIDRFVENAKSINLQINSQIVEAYNLTLNGYESPIGNKLATLDKKTAVMFSINGNSVKFSFRSKGGQSPNALDLAKLLGGDGHENSAGAEIPLSDFIKIIIQ